MPGFKDYDYFCNTILAIYCNLIFFPIPDFKGTTIAIVQYLGLILIFRLGSGHTYI